jgi:hypothetical protein
MFKEFPPRYKPGNFSLDQVLEKLPPAPVPFRVRRGLVEALLETRIGVSDECRKLKGMNAEHELQNCWKTSPFQTLMLDCRPLTLRHSST